MMLTTPRKPATLLDVARATGLSKSTVSAALSGNSRHSEATRKIVLDAAQELNYTANYHAQGLRKQSSDVIGFFRQAWIWAFRRSRRRRFRGGFANSAIKFP